MAEEIAQEIRLVTGASLKVRKTDRNTYWLTLRGTTTASIEERADEDDIDYLIATLTRMRGGR